MNVPAAQLKKAIESLPDPQSFPNSFYKVAIFKGPEPVLAHQDEYAPEVPVDVVEVLFVKNSLTRQWDMKGILQVASLAASLKDIDEDVAWVVQTADREANMFRKILFELFKRVPMPDELLLIEKKIVPNTGDRKLDLFFFGSKLGTIEYLTNGLQFTPSKQYGGK